MSKSWVMDLTWVSTTLRSKSARAPVKLQLANGIGEGVGGAFELGTFVCERIGNGEENAAESGAAHLVFRREIGAAKKRLAIGEKKTC